MDGGKRKETLMVLQQQPPLRGFFFPMLCPGHMIPLIDIAKLLSRRGVAATIVTTPGNEPLARPAIDTANSSSSSSIPIELILLPFPPSTAHLLPGDGRENLTNIPPSYYPHLFTAINSLRPSLHDLLLRRRPDFLVSDAVLIWTAGMAADLRITRIVFDGPGAFLLSVHESLALMQSRGWSFPDDDDAPTIVDGLPDRIQLTKPEISVIFQYREMIESMKAAEEKSFGVVVNTFRDLEPAYADLFRRRRAGRRAWFVGPVSLSNADEISRADRGSRAHKDTARLIMSWLDAQPARSVVYACFGSLSGHDRAQARELEAGLELAGFRFIWAAGDWEGFRERVEERGLVVRGWVPQVAILAHAAVGAFLTHCGWNSTLEGVAAGVPLAAWPLMYDQFVNERLITDVLGVGVRVRKRRGKPEAVAAEEVAAAVGRVMGDGEEAEGIRRRARELAELAKEAVEAGGSSFEDVGRMMEEVEAEVRRVAGERKEEGDSAAHLD